MSRSSTRCSTISVSVSVWNTVPFFSSSSRSSRKFSMMPLWTTATRSVACGWALFSVGLPWVAQRVWPMPVCPSSGSASQPLLQVLQLALGAAALEMLAFERGDAGGIVAAIFKTFERIHQLLCNRRRARECRQSRTCGSISPKSSKNRLNERSVFSEVPKEPDTQ